MLGKYIEEIKKIKMLSPQEEKDLWSNIADGDIDSRSKIIINYQPLVFKTALKFSLPEEQTLELVQEGMVGLIESLERFDHTRGVAFSLFALHRIRGRMIDCLKKYYGNDMAYLDEPVYDSETLLDKIADEKAGPDRIIEEQDVLRRVKQSLDALPEKEHKVVCGIYLDDLTPENMAQTIASSRTHVYRLQKQGIKRMRGMLSKFMHEIKW